MFVSCYRDDYSKNMKTFNFCIYMFLICVIFLPSLLTNFFVMNSIRELATFCSLQCSRLLRYSVFSAFNVLCHEMQKKVITADGYLITTSPQKKVKLVLVQMFKPVSPHLITLLTFKDLEKFPPDHYADHDIQGP